MRKIGSGKMPWTVWCLTRKNNYTYTLQRWKDLWADRILFSHLTPYMTSLKIYIILLFGPLINYKLFKSRILLYLLFSVLIKYLEQKRAYYMLFGWVNPAKISWNRFHRRKSIPTAWDHPRRHWHPWPGTQDSPLWESQHSCSSPTRPVPQHSSYLHIFFWTSFYLAIPGRKDPRLLKEQICFRTEIRVRIAQAPKRSLLSGGPLAHPF
jgi:hypothetical protein